MCLSWWGRSLKMSRKRQAQRYVWIGPRRLPVVAARYPYEVVPCSFKAAGGGINTGTAYAHGASLGRARTQDRGATRCNYVGERVKSRDGPSWVSLDFLIRYWL